MMHMPSSSARTGNHVVSFAENVQIYFTPPLVTYTSDEIDASWVGPHDTEASQTDLAKCVRAARRTTATAPKTSSSASSSSSAKSSFSTGFSEATENILEKQGLSTRGIEHLANPSTLRKHKAQKDQVITAVLDVQQQERLRRARSSNYSRLGEAAADDDDDDACCEKEALREISVRLSVEASKAALRKGLADQEYVRRNVLVVPRRGGYHYQEAAGGAAAAPAAGGLPPNSEQQERRTSSGSSKELGAILKRVVDIIGQEPSLSSASSPPRPKLGVSAGKDLTARRHSSGKNTAGNENITTSTSTASS